MHFKSLHNFLLIVLCTIGIGFVSAPPAAAALTFADGTTKTTVWASVTSGEYTRDVSFNVNYDGTGEPTITFDKYDDQLSRQITKLKAGVYQVKITIALKESFKGDIIGTVSAPGSSNITATLKVSYTKPSTGGTITLSHTAFDLNASKTDNEWKTNGKLVRELTVTSSGINGNITLSVSPMGNYGLTVTPTTLPAAGGKVTITYKPQTGNAVHTNPYPVLSVKADNATTKTAELKTTWDGTTHTEGVTAVPDIPAGTFDPEIYECKAFKGRNTVSLRWELKNPDDIELKSYPQSAINSEVDETTKARMIAWNEAYDKYSAITYTLYRDGKEIVSGLDITSYVDMNVPEGDHKYYVVAHYRNGLRTASSDETTVKVERDMAITNYVLEEIYNYPIVDEEGYNNLQGDKTKSFKAFGTVEGDAAGVNREGFLYKYNFDGKGDPIDPSQGKASGAPGDGVRQGVFCNGLWYIAMVSNRKAEKWVDPQGKDNTDRKANALGYAAKEYPSDEVGHILTITADGINNNPLKIRSKLRTLSNQSLTVIPNTTDKWSPYLYFRGYNGEVTNTNVLAGERYFETITDLGGCFAYYQTKHWAADPSIKTEANSVDPKVIPQYYRTHYMAARGKVEEGTGKLCFAMNMSHDAYIVDLDNSGNPTAYHKITAPSTATTAAGKTVDIDAGTENYIFPVEGEPNKYIHVMRSSGVFLVDVTDINNPSYTLISADLSEVRSASGMTFTLQNTMDGSTDLFYIHGTSLNSNNPGHFRIDMPQRTRDAQGNYTGNISTANFSDMVPMASKLQDAIPGFEAGNSNGMWFGTKDATEDGIAVKYIYQYVPGVRFAKYKFYPVQAFPPARPTIDVVIRHDDPAKDNTPHMAGDITHFDIAYSWKRPAKFGSLPGAALNFKIDGYNAELLDPNGHVIETRYVAAQAGETDETVYGPFYYNKHTPAAGGKLDFSSYKPETASQGGLFDIHDGNYVINVTPVYVSVNDASRKYTGENGLAQDATDYTPEILNIRAKLFQAKDNTNLYRVDIDFNRAPRHDDETSFANPGGKGYTFYKGDENAANHKLAEPASRFKLEVSKNGGKTWQAIDNLRVFYDGKILINENNSTEKDEINRINANITEHNGEIHSGVHNGFIEHDYNFGGHFSARPGRSNVKARAAGQLDTYGDKMYVQEAIAHLYGDVSTVDQKVLDAEKSAGAFQAVAYHMVDGSTEDVTNIRNWKYRATALYADNQPYASIKRSASVETTLGDPTTTGVEDAIADAAEGVHIWPVPAESELHIAAGEAIESVSIYNISGSCVASFEGNGDTTMTVSVDNLASGVYFVKVNANAARRLIKR